MIKNLLINWKTTSAGLTSIAVAIIHLLFQVRSHTADESAWTVAVLAILTGLGFLFAGDSNKSAPKSDMDAMKQQIAQVPNAINSGDTAMLSKTIDQPQPKPKD